MPYLQRLVREALKKLVREITLVKGFFVELKTDAINGESVDVKVVARKYLGEKWQ